MDHFNLHYLIKWNETRQISRKKKGETCCSERNRDNYKYSRRSSYLSKGEIEAGKTHFEKQKISSKQVKKILSPWKLFEFWFFSSFDVSKQSLNPSIESFS